MKYHLVLVTKYRNKCFTNSILERLREIFFQQCEKWDANLLEFGGEKDHVHLLLDLYPNIEPAKLINSLKTVSSRLIRKEYSKHLAKYYWKPVLWSRAYCLISAGGAPLYINNQDRPTCKGLYII
jgi:putative transposase